MMKKTNFYIIPIIVISLCILGLTLIVYREWTHKNPPIIEMEKKPFIMKENILEGRTNCGKVSVLIDNKQNVDLNVCEGKFFLDIDVLNLKVGWHYFIFSAKHPLTRWTVYNECFIQIIQKQANVYVPALYIEAGRLGNRAYNKDYRDGIIQNYTPDSKYFDQKGFCEESDTVKFDENGIVLVKYEEWEYNPVSVAQQALGHYNVYIESGDTKEKEKFLNICNWFLFNQSEKGAYPYYFSFMFKPDTELPEGFVSAMAQGQILSVLARAYRLTGNTIYLQCGEKALKFMITPGDDSIFSGCSKTLQDICQGKDNMNKYSDYVVYEEYVFNPSTYVLNGNLFALIGLADWMMTAPKEFGMEEAKIAFEKGIKGIEILLPYYDYYGYSSYDLFQYTSEGGHIPYFTSYYAHKCHIYLLDALAGISGSTIFRKYAELFKDYSDDTFWKQTEVLYEQGRGIK